MLKLLCLLGLAALAEAAGPACTFVANCDCKPPHPPPSRSHARDPPLICAPSPADAQGGRDSAPATTKEECCSACQASAKTGCAAGVWDGKTCWFKTAKEVSGGCQHSSRSKFACLTALAPKPPTPPPPPSPAELALVKQYTTQKNETCAKVLAKLPTLDSSEEAAFMKAYANLATNGSDTGPVVAAAEKLLDSADMKKFLSAADSFTAGGLDADMVLCAVMSDATPAGLAHFAAKTAANEKQVTALLTDFTMMRDMLVAGGAVSSENGKGSNPDGPYPAGAKFADALGIYNNITKASAALSSLAATADTLWDDRSPANILKRLALGTALQHAVPIHQRYADPLDPSTFFIDPVERYLHYETAYKAGDLDPAFEVLTAFEIRHTTNSDAMHQDLTWMRE